MRVRVALLSAALFTLSCTPSSVKRHRLYPVSGQGVTTLDQLAPELGAEGKLGEDEIRELRDVVVFSSGDFVLALRLQEMENILYLYSYFYNGTDGPLTLSPSIFQLVDATKRQLRRLSPHEAANTFLQEVGDIPPYEPKYEYDVTTYNYGNYSSSQVTQRETTASAIGNSIYSIGAAIQASHNEKLQETAAMTYSIGLVPDTELGPDAYIEFGVYWLNDEAKSYPLELRMPGTDLSVRFKPPN